MSKASATPPARAAAIRIAPALVAALALAACGKQDGKPPAPPAPPATAAGPVPVVLPPGPHREVAGPIQWDAAKSAFVFQGQPLRAEKLWSFEGATDGFTSVGADVLPAARSGLSVSEIANDSLLRTPRGLNVDGHTRSLVLVRATRVRTGPPFDGSVYYATATHGESAAFHARPVAGKDPAVGETATLVFDMHRLSKGDMDWRNSIIDQVRVDLDDGHGGAFIVHQIAIAQNPGGIPLGAPLRGVGPGQATAAPAAH